MKKPRPPRVPVSLSTTFEHAGSKTAGAIVNIGLGGAFVTADAALAYAEQVVLIARFPGCAEPLRLAGTVRWSDVTGFGVQFESLGAREAYTISRLMTSCRQMERNVGAQESVPPGP
ncbi:MAG TPA: PilZ domain-containing protein [Polyangiaceae bacterium]|nr:PilZ domain-containing protein [Polyangiaceae bacterium]